MPMNREEKIDHLLRVHEPDDRNRGLIYGITYRVLAGQKPHAETPIAARMLEAFNAGKENMHYLCGIISVMPQGTVWERQAGDLLLEANALLRSKDWGPSLIRKIRKNGEDIKKLAKNVRLTTKSLDEGLAAIKKK